MRRVFHYEKRHIVFNYWFYMVYYDFFTRESTKTGNVIKVQKTDKIL